MMEAMANAQRPDGAFDMSAMMDFMPSMEDFGVVAPVAREVLQQLYGTDKPTRAAVRGNLDFFFHDIERGTGVYIVLYESDFPREVLRGSLALVARGLGRGQVERHDIPPQRAVELAPVDPDAVRVAPIELKELHPDDRHPLAASRTAAALRPIVVLEELIETTRRLRTADAPEERLLVHERSPASATARTFLARDEHLSRRARRTRHLHRPVRHYEVSRQSPG
jgi:hypothetical protein